MLENSKTIISFLLEFTLHNIFFEAIHIKMQRLKILKSNATQTNKLFEVYQPAE
jgi:hypothetical protein